MCTRLRICQDVVMLCQVKATGSGHRLNLVVREQISIMVPLLPVAL